MSTPRPAVLLVFDGRVRDKYIAQPDLDRLHTFADWDWLRLEGGVAFGPNDDPAAIARLRDRVGDVDALVVCHGSPRISAEIMAHAPRLRLIGELEGDRFAERIDLEPPGSAASAPSTPPTAPPTRWPSGRWRSSSSRCATPASSSAG